MQRDQWPNGPAHKGSFTSHKEHTQESPNISHQINGGTSILISQGDVPLLPYDRNNSSEGEIEGIFHCHVLQPCKGKIS